MEDLSAYLDNLTISEDLDFNSKKELDNFSNLLDKLESLSIRENLSKNIINDKINKSNNHNLDDNSINNKFLKTVYLTGKIYNYLKRNNIKYKLTFYKKIIIFRCQNELTFRNHLIIINFNSFEIQYRILEYNKDVIQTKKRKRNLQQSCLQNYTQLTCKKICKEDDISKISVYLV